jgi:predicted NUDIX family NTP pyrophosphohydrolase
MGKPVSSGTLLYRTGRKGLEVLIVHPAGNYNKNAAWSIPKGKLDAGETPEDAARRELWEETHVKAPEKLESLGNVTYKSKKKVHCYCGEAPANTRPKCDTWEVDRAEFMPLEEAEKLLHDAQKEFIRRLRKHIGEDR